MKPTRIALLLLVSTTTACGWSSYPGPESIPLARADDAGRTLVLECELVRPLTGSFWGIRAGYQAQFAYHHTAGGDTAHGYFAAAAKSRIRDPAAARALCEGRRYTIVVRDDDKGMDILGDGRRVGTVGAGGRFDAAEAIGPLESAGG